MTVRIRLYTEQDRERWDGFVNASDSSACYHLAGWKNVIERSFGHRTYYLLAEDSGNEIKGILPIVQLKSVIFGNFMVSLPYFNYGGICARNDEIGRLLLEEAVLIGRRQGAEHLELRHTRHMDGKLQEKTSKVSMTLSLPRQSQELWDGFPSKLRSQIKKPSKEGMYFRIGGEDELESFYSVFSINMRELGTPVYSIEFFRSILREFPDKARICTVYAPDGTAVASGFLVGFKSTLEIPWASSISSYNRHSPNMLLYWSVLQFACEKGYATFDFGRSTPGEGTYRFKQQWGAKPVQLYWHYWLKNGGQMPGLNPHNPKYQTAIRIWRRLPVSLTRLIGPMIVKNLP